jgi:LAS superfamily LD-carboxypeptidase LdcB
LTIANDFKIVKSNTFFKNLEIAVIKISKKNFYLVGVLMAMTILTVVIFFFVTRSGTNILSVNPAIEQNKSSIISSENTSVSLLVSENSLSSSSEKVTNSSIGKKVNSFSSQNKIQDNSSINSIISSSSQNQNQSNLDNLLSSISSANMSISSSAQSVIEEVKINLRQLSGLEFQNIFESMSYQKVEMLPNHTNITDNPVVDNRIREIAQNRGYKKRPSAIGQMILIDGERLQVEASQAWTNLKNSAKNEGFNIVLTSGFRSPQSQRDLFVSSMAPEYSTQDFLDGKIDPELNVIMNRISPPGYSRHHTGYTIDIACVGESTTFKLTSCYKWASANNFAKVRQFGWIPSYPNGVTNQGPLPEEWEFVWVGELAR